MVTLCFGGRGCGAFGCTTAEDKDGAVGAGGGTISLSIRFSIDSTVALSAFVCCTI